MKKLKKFITITLIGGIFSSSILTANAATTVSSIDYTNSTGKSITYTVSYHAYTVHRVGISSRQYAPSVTVYSYSPWASPNTTASLSKTTADSYVTTFKQNL